MIFNQIFDAINLGLVILDKDLKVQKWNRWMEIHSGISADNIIGSSVIETFPNLDNTKFKRSCKSVFAFGNLCFFSQKLHKYLFPFKSTSYFKALFEYMQQSCAMGPLRDENNEIQSIFIYIQDVTEVAMYERKLMEMNMKDGLTGIYNRRYMEIKLKEEFHRCKRYGGELSIIMFDIDHFKKVNDDYGHQCGDHILQSLSSTVTAVVRSVDYLYRYGGEEFCCLLPETKLEGALQAAERIRNAVSEMDTTYNGRIIKITVSLGVAGIDEAIDSVDMFLKKADDALYQAKREGRNRVVKMR